MDDERRMIPLMVSSDTVRVLFIGGGKVALRKAEHLKGCSITVLAKDITDELKALASRIVVGNAEDFYQDLISDHSLIIAATDDRVLNNHIVHNAKTAGKLVNSVHGGGNFMIPSTLRRSDFVITASTEGRAPFFPPLLIETIDERLGPEFDKVAEALAAVRPMILSSGMDQKSRASALESLMRHPRVWEAALEGCDVISVMIELMEAEGCL